MHSLANIIEEIEGENKEKENRRIRRVVAKQERLKVCPPRLGKRKYGPLFPYADKFKYISPFCDW